MASDISAFEIIDLTDEQTEFIDSSLEKHDKRHMSLKLCGEVSIGVMRGGELIAGANGCMTAFRIFYVSTVFVDESCRRQGIGRKLMEAMEEKAEKLGANIIRLDTFDFQGPLFYRSLDYECVGAYECREDRYTEYFFVKRLIPFSP